MFFSSSFVTLLQVAAVLSATIAGVSEIRAVDADTFTFSGQEIHVATVPIASSLHAPNQNDTSHLSALSKRLTTDACFTGCPVMTCTNGLSTLGAPSSADCTSLASAINALAKSELGPFPCSFNNPSCPNFSVLPGYERQYTLGTCLVGFANLNPTGGATLSYCDYLVGGGLPSVFSTCVTKAGNTGGFCSSQGTGTLYAIEVRHS